MAEKPSTAVPQPERFVMLEPRKPNNLSDEQKSWRVVDLGVRERFTMLPPVEGKPVPPSAPPAPDVLPQLRTAVAELPEPVRVVLELSLFQGLTADQIAARLGLPVATVRQRYQTARDRLARALAAPAAPLGETA